MNNRKLIDILSTADGTLFALDNFGYIWNRNIIGTYAWVELPTEPEFHFASKLFLMPGDRIGCLDADGLIWLHRGGWQDGKAWSKWDPIDFDVAGLW